MSKTDKNSKMRYLAFLLVLVALVTWTCVTTAQATPIGSAEIEDCVVNEFGIDCEATTVVTVPVSYGMETTMAAVTVDGALETEVEIEITKTEPRLIYPLTHFHTVSYFPWEEVIKVQNAIPGQSSCVSCADSANPTCGWTFKGAEKIEDSQGFCCNKDVEELSSACSWRGEEILGEQSNPLNSFSTAHCLSQGELFYHGYEIGEFHKTYQITVNFTKGGEESHTFTISPEVPIYNTEHDTDYSGNFTMKAQLLDDLGEYRGASELDNYILYIPSAPDNHPFVQDYQNNMLLVPREEVSKDGGELDKVGVSFHTFRMMGSDCRVTVAGDGLHNQLFQKHNSDLQKLVTNPDAETTYLVHGKKEFKGSMEFEPGMKKFLEYSIPDINYSLVSLTTDVDTLQMVETESLGVIVEAYVETFTSMSEDGTLNVIIQNYGDLKTDYIVTVTEPNPHIIHAIPAQARTLAPMEEATLTFDVYTAFNLDITNEFKVTLKSPTDRLYDEVYVIFDTLKHHSKYSWELQQKNEAS